MNAAKINANITAPANQAKTAKTGLASNAAAVETNVMGIAKAVGPNKANQPADVKKIQTRLSELGYLEAPQINGQMDAATSDAIQSFQTEHKADIDQIRADSGKPVYDQGGKAGKKYKAGVVSPNDATHQALANAWPRTINGKLMSEPQAYAYLAGTVKERVGKFDDSQVNLVGVRGYQGGASHANPGVQHAKNTYNDEIFVMYKDDAGKPHVKSFKGTVDPGGRKSAGPGPDPKTSILHADQQIQYALGKGPAKSFGNRPALWMKTSAGVVRGGETFDHALVTRGGSVKKVTKGIAVHSGGKGTKVFASSTGCQVVHGSWYPAFFEQVSRGVKPEHDSMVTYTLIDGSSLD